MIAKSGESAMIQTGSLERRDFGAGQHHDEVGNRCRDDHARRHLRQVGQLDQSGHKGQHDHNDDNHKGPDCPANRAARQRVRHRTPVLAEIAPEDDVLRESQSDANRCGAEAVVESGVGL
jgi:hypothetical protein